MSEWLELARRCEQATGADRELDREISKAVGDGPSLTPYTGSLDCITALIERELPGRLWAAWRHETGAKAALDPTLTAAVYADAETPALALCAAFCRAMAERGK